MKAWWFAYLAWLVRVTKRERIILTVCICVVIWFVFDTFLISPKQKQISIFAELLSSRSADLATLNTQLEGIRSGNVPVGDPALHTKLAEVSKEKSAIDASLRASQHDLVSPEAMPRLLEDLLRRNPRLKLVSLKTLPRSTLLAAAPATNRSNESADTPPDNSDKATKPTITNAQDSNMYRHGVELAVEGNYLDVLTYLQEVEKLPWKMYWAHLSMESSAEATPIFRFSIYTLSFNDTWLAL